MLQHILLPVFLLFLLQFQMQSTGSPLPAEVSSKTDGAIKLPFAEINVRYDLYANKKYRLV
jgi:hypothetical protein